MWDFSRAIAVNCNSIPTCPVCAQVIDPHELCWGIEHIDAGFFLTLDLVHFSSTCYPSWLIGPRGLFEAPGTTWWREHAKELPLLQEIQHMVKSGKPCKSDAKGHENLVVVKVRGKIFLVANTPRNVSLALACTPEAMPGSFEDQTGILGWFLTELSKDMQAFKENLAFQENLAQVETKSSRKPLGDANGRGDGAALAITEGLEVLTPSPNVRHATLLQSKSVQQFCTKKRKAHDMSISEAVCSDTANALQGVERGD